jgi:hypothetical protein
MAGIQGRRGFAVCGFCRRSLHIYRQLDIRESYKNNIPGIDLGGSSDRAGNECDINECILLLDINAGRHGISDIRQRRIKPQIRARRKKLLGETTAD